MIVDIVSGEPLANECQDWWPEASVTKQTTLIRCKSESNSNRL